MVFQTEDKEPPLGQFEISSSLQAKLGTQPKHQNSLQIFLCGFLESYENGVITLLEGDQRSLSEIHRELHHLIINSVELGYKVNFIDLCDSFAPILISSIYSDSKSKMSSLDESLNLFKPQSLEELNIIISILSRNVAERKKESKQVFIITFISNYIEDFSDESDSNLVFCRLEHFRYILAKLQVLAKLGFTIILTDKVDSNLMKQQKLQATDKISSQLPFVNKLYLQIRLTEIEQKLDLSDDTILECVKSKSRRDYQISIPTQQKTLYDWF